MVFKLFVFFSKAPHRALDIEPKICQTARQAEYVTRYDSLAQLYNLSDSVCQILGEFCCLQIALERTFTEDRYYTRFFGYHHSHRIGLLRYAHCGTVTQTELLGQFL